MYPSGSTTPACPSREWWWSRKTLCSKPGESFLLAALSSQGTHCPPAQHWEHTLELEMLELWLPGLSPGWGLDAAAAAAFTAWLFWVQLALPTLSWLRWHCCGAAVAVRVVEGSLWQCYTLWWTENQPFLLSGHRQKKCFSFGSCGLNYCCLLPLSREDWKLVGLGLASIRAFFSSGV